MFYLFFFETMHRNGYIIISFHQKEEKNISVGILRGARNGEGGGGEGRYAVRLHVVKFFMHAHS